MEKWLRHVVLVLKALVAEAQDISFSVNRTITTDAIRGVQRLEVRSIRA